MKLTDLAPPKVVSASEVGHAADKFPESDLPFYRKLGRTSDLHHYIYSSMSGALLNLCGRRSSVREKVVLATVTYIKSPEMAIAALLDQFEELGIDYIDVLFWGWIGSNDGQALQDCLQLSPDLRGPNTVYQRTIERMFNTSERLKKMGVVRYIGASFHDVNLACQQHNCNLCGSLHCQKFLQQRMKMLLLIFAVLTKLLKLPLYLNVMH